MVEKIYLIGDRIRLNYLYGNVVEGEIIGIIPCNISKDGITQGLSRIRIRTNASKWEREQEYLLDNFTEFWKQNLRIIDRESKLGLIMSENKLEASLR